MFIRISQSFILFIINCLTAPSHGTEYCWESFNATCPEGHVIQMEKAFYGRMRLGRCLDRDYYVGCQADILTQMERKCSGRRYCVLDIPDTDLHKMQPCPKDLVAYLEAKYSCLKVAHFENQVCQPNKYFPLLTESLGYISNMITEELNQGSPTCPWLIQVPEGQTISLTLVDYAWFGTAGGRGSGSMCVMYAVIREAVSPDSRTDVTVCGGERREKLIHESESNSVIVEIMNTNPLQEKRPYFLLKYQAIGCRSLKWPPNGYVDRRGDRATVSCNYTTDVWHLVCSGNNWVGSYHNCTTVPPIAGEMDAPRRPEHSSFPFGVFLAVAIGIALGVFTGLLLLSTVICCRRERRLRICKHSGNLAGGATWPTANPEDEVDFTLSKSRIPADSKFCYDRVCNELAHHVTSGESQGQICSCSAAVVRFDGESLYSPTKVFSGEIAEYKSGTGQPTRLALVSGHAALHTQHGTPSFFLEHNRPQPQGGDGPARFIPGKITEDIYRD